MKTEIKDLWVQALRSGKFNQAEGALCRTGEGHCCLGVLTELFDEAHPGVLTRTNLTSEVEFLYKSASNTTYSESLILPEPVKEWAGMQYKGGQLYRHPYFNPDLTDPEMQEQANEIYNEASLVDFNDNGMNFSRIADVIDYFGDDL